LNLLELDLFLYFKNDPNRISGKYCECDNESCDRYLGLVCAGNGRCDCGICKCNQGWSGSDCKCSTDNSTCESSNGVCCYVFY
jgi:integrin beta 1